MNWLYEPWPWYVGGPLISFIMFVLVFFGKSFGMSSNLRTLCTICGAGKKTSFFNFDWKHQKWNLMFALGTVIGGAIAANFLSIDTAVHVSENTTSSLSKLGIVANNSYVPKELFNSGSIKSILILLVGGVLVGFGARYAGGCTSGHAISGLSNLQLPSLIAIIGFFIGGLAMIYGLFPILF